MPFVYFGRTHSFVGKSVWEIVCSLKDYGVGRILIRNRMQRYNEPCFMRIVSAKPKMDEDNQKGSVFVESIFRGINYGVVEISRISYKTDHSLIPKHEEHKYIKAYEQFVLKDVKIFSRTAEMPPLMKLLAEKRGHHATHYEMSFKKLLQIPNPRTRLAEEGETPTISVTYSLGDPACPKLYEGFLDLPVPDVNEIGVQKEITRN